MTAIKDRQKPWQNLQPSLTMSAYRQAAVSRIKLCLLDTFGWRVVRVQPFLGRIGRIYARSSEVNRSQRLGKGFQGSVSNAASANGIGPCTLLKIDDCTKPLSFTRERGPLAPALAVAEHIGGCNGKESWLCVAGHEVAIRVG